MKMTGRHDVCIVILLKARKIDRLGENKLYFYYYDTCTLIGATRAQLLGGEEIMCCSPTRGSCAPYLPFLNLLITITIQNTYKKTYKYSYLKFKYLRDILCSTKLRISYNLTVALLR